MPEDLVVAARREEIAWVLSEGVHETVPLDNFKDAGKKLLDVISVDAEMSVERAQKKCDRDLEPENTRPRSKANFKEPYLLLSCSLHTS